MRNTRLGAIPLADRQCRFEVWAPRTESVAVRLTGPEERLIPMERRPGGYHVVVADDIPPDARYLYRLHYEDGAEIDRPDPASRYQPDGVHRPSQIVPTAFDWTDGGWHGLPLSRYVIYELHVGTFSHEGTFDGVIAHLGYLQDLGVTAVELMPVAQFPGSRNWGYDGVHPFAAQNSYGGPEGLKRLVDACHRKGFAVVLDVVYNHLGPEGNYLRDFAPYFTDFYRTPWGDAVNFDGPFSDDVRRYFIENALQWVDEFRIDALRIDAVHAILDFSARPFLEELGRAVHRRAEALNRTIQLIAESALNDTRIIRPRELGGFAMDAQWNDDFHHALRTALTGENAGYYRDYNGVEDLGTAWRDGYVYSGQYSRFRRHAYGNTSREIPARRFVVFSQNHDQVGNRMEGDRLSANVPFEKLKLAAGIVLLSPFIPLIFMGEEYGETAPFLYFVSHNDPDLVQAVRDGRRREFAAFDWNEKSPDLQAKATFRQSRLNHDLRNETPHRVLFEFYRELLRSRKRLPSLANLSKKGMSVPGRRHEKVLAARRWFGGDEVVLLFNFNERPETIPVKMPPGTWRKRIDSADTRWLGPGSRVPEILAINDDAVTFEASPHSVILFSKEQAE